MWRGGRHPVQRGGAAQIFKNMYTNQQKHKRTFPVFGKVDGLQIEKTTIYLCFSLARTSVENEIEPFMMRRSDLLNRLTALALTMLSTLSNLPKCHLVIGISQFM